MISEQAPQQQATIDRELSSFMLPEAALSNRLMTAVAGEFAYQVVRLLFHTAGDAIHQRSRGVLALLSLWIGSEHDFDVVWDGVFGDVYDAVRSKDAASKTAAAAALALHLAAHGFSGEWEISFDQPLRLRWGWWLLPRASRIAVQSDGHRALIKASVPGAPQQAALHRRDGVWEAQGLERLPLIGGAGSPLTLCPADACLPLAQRQLAGAPPVAALDAGQIAAWQRGLDLLDIGPAAAYRQWVGRAIRQIVVTQPADPPHSGLIPNHFGRIHSSAYETPAALAERLVYAAAQQYFDLIGRVTALEDGSDDPKAHVTETLGLYHAISNVLLVRRLLQPQPGQAEDRLAAQQQQLQARLHTANGLTSVGQQLFASLRAVLG
ncbi:MAG: hypothetical protein OHK0022_15000 [Roseiflexaceae bacterium]